MSLDYNKKNIKAKIKHPTKLLLLVIFILLFLFCCAGCQSGSNEKKPNGAIDATDHGLSVENSGIENSRNLQKLIDTLSVDGGTIYISPGKYKFAENGKQTIGSHCIKMRSNVNIVGNGEDTILMPVGKSQYGLDMFYFNDYLDTGEGQYLENCRFESFVIDASHTSCEVYTSAGKGFMFNLFRNCHWDGVIVKNTDATGFGVDCPLSSSISNCIAEGCGKAATDSSGGASGFGIGFGYCDGENLTISNCSAYENKKFGFFFEHQGRFDAQKYTATESHNFLVTNSNASNNLYNFGGIYTTNTYYKNCTSFSAKKYGFYFENSTNSQAFDCTSVSEREAAYTIVQSAAYEVCRIAFRGCSGKRFTGRIFSYERRQCADGK